MINNEDESSGKVTLKSKQDGRKFIRFKIVGKSNLKFDPPMKN